MHIFPVQRKQPCDASNAFVLYSSSCWESAAPTRVISLFCEAAMLTVIIRPYFGGRCFSEISIDMLTGLCPSLILLHHRVKSGYPVRKKCVWIAVMVRAVLVCSLQASIPDKDFTVTLVQMVPCTLFQKWNIQLNVSTTQQRSSVPHQPCQMWRVVPVA